MRNFEKKLKYLSTLFIYKFKSYDHGNQKLKLYFISPDMSHVYISVDRVKGEKHVYLCEVGELYLDEKRKTTFEDTPTESFCIGDTEYRVFKKYHDNQPIWVSWNITNIINSFNINEKIWFF
jgi:hypothetical protein